VADLLVLTTALVVTPSLVVWAVPL